MCGVAGGSEQSPDLVERFDVRDRIGARCPADGRLIHFVNGLNEFEAGNDLARGLWTLDLGLWAPEFLFQGRQQTLMNERALAGATDARDDDETVQRKLNRQVFQIVLAGGVQD